MEVVLSPSESKRFGLAVARLHVDASNLDDAIAAVAASNSDVVIVRSPAADMEVPAMLARMPGYESFHADTLIYWSWAGDRSGPAVGMGPLVARDVRDGDEISTLVRNVFDGYANHYAANPLFERSLALDGYCEWAASLVRSGDATCTVLDGPDGQPAGFGIVDWGTDPADVRLAGIVTDARGRGWYRWIVAQLMHEAHYRGRAPLWISTQAHNVAVMRTWARLGWLPIHAILTTHLVRVGLMTHGKR